MSLIILSLLLAVQEAPAEKLTYPDVLLSQDPLAPLPEGVVEQRGKADTGLKEMVEDVVEASPGPPPPAAIPTCNTRLFRSEIEIVGPPRRTSPILLCANSNDPADYETMLRSAREQIAINDDFTFGSRARATADIDAELARIEEPVADPDGYVGR